MRVKSYGAGAIGGVVLVVLGALLWPAAAEPAPTCTGRAATIVGTDGEEDLTGTEGDDVVWLGAGQDRFRGGAGNDTVCGGPGKDSVYGEAGDDWLGGGNGADYNVIGGTGDDVVHGGAGDDLNIHGDGSREDGTDRVYGDDGDDDIGGEPGTGVDVIEGGAGTDAVSFYLSGRSVRIDVAAGTATGDAVDTLSGLEIYSGSEYADVLTGSSGADYLVGVYGDDVVNGRGGDDTLAATSGEVIGGSGRDTLRGPDEDGHGLSVDLGWGADRAVLDAMRNSTVSGGPGNDVFEVPEPGFGVDAGGTYVHLRGGPDVDTLTFAGNPHRVRIDAGARTATWSKGQITFAHVNEFHGSERGDVLLGSADADLLFGRGGDDVLKGLRGPDVLRGGKGWDTAYGGRGRDTCTAEHRFSCERS
ncbi:MAG: calcium-binding protein [Carbonactinosporaceae bacterium]